MLDPKQLDELARRFSESLPPGLREFQQEVEKNVRAVMQSTFTRMDLITRDEFDAQAKMLARTRARLEELERQVAELESTLKSAAGTSEPTPSKAAGKPAPRRSTRKGNQQSGD